MGQTFIYRLTPRSAFHFGERGVGLEETADILHSDTLFAAIVSAWQVIGADVAAWVAPFATDPPFRVSSGFPFAGSVLFYPCPASGVSDGKWAKKIDLLSEKALQGIAKGSRPDPALELIQSGHAWVLVEERDQLISLAAQMAPADEQSAQRQRLKDEPSRLKVWTGSGEPPVPHVVLDRVTNKSNVYFAGRLSFAVQCGLYFWARFEEDAYRTRLEQALDYLSEAGLGGRRSYGHGQFTWKSEERTLPAIENPNWQMTLSLYHPPSSERAQGVLEGARYSTILRRGWISSPEHRDLRRKSLWMLREGALFRVGEKIRGDLCEVKPDGPPTVSHPVQRAGFALTLPIRLEEQA